MNSIDIKNGIKEYLKSHNYISIAVCYNNKPYASKVKYVSENFDLYFATFKDTNKAKYMLRNNFIAGTVDENNIDEFIQLFGEVVLLEEKDERIKAIDVLKEIFPYAKYWIYADDVLFFKIKPITIKYSKGPAKRSKGQYFGNVYELNL
ncbi:MULTISPECIES: pyridoxamine 5'-phosphate oxidase family protein [Clostridium]|uniref:pyridoxamine 5'-phosphate oxidase family protein n=1 Tax=Clostridium TaxID=1485 RepID=UPI00069D134E|nr:MULTISPECIES: pyridoxamine 5'-phosphate oxidase family protein [Clostridium]KOF56688.1 hypothetical protein AGR56_08205 [Clostridium sp. DMHC 10]MCD2346685.1 pyridoxamine 5'-phosphate oxidase family protein [Clostridium guangxiense]